METGHEVQPGTHRGCPDVEDTLLKEERAVVSLPGARLARVLTSFSISVNGVPAELNATDVNNNNWENVEFLGVTDVRFRGGSLCAWLYTPIADYALMLPHQDYSDKWEGTLNALGSEAARAKCGMWPVGGTHPEWWGEAWKDDWPFKPRSTLKRRASTEILRGESASRRTAAAPGQSDNQTPVLGPQRSTDDTDKRPTYFVRFGPWKLQPDGGSMPSPSTASRGRGKGRGDRNA